MGFTTTIGTIGASLILLAFILNQLGKWKKDYLIYDFINFIGALLLMAYAAILLSWPFLVLNTVWAGLSLRDLFQDFSRNKKRTSKNLTSKWLK